MARIRSIDDRDYYLGGIKLDHADFEKDQGVLFSHNLSWNDHVDLISLKAQRMLNVLYRTCRDINDISTKKLLYITWVRLRLEYASGMVSSYQTNHRQFGTSSRQGHKIRSWKGLFWV